MILPFKRRFRLEALLRVGGRNFPQGGKRNHVSPRFQTGAKYRAPVRPAREAEAQEAGAQITIVDNPMGRRPVPTCAK
jgi:hypothetical protein